MSDAETFAIFGGFIFIFFLLTVMFASRLGLVAGLLMTFASLVVLAVMGNWIWSELM